MQLRTKITFHPKVWHQNSHPAPLFTQQCTCPRFQFAKISSNFWLSLFVEEAQHINVKLVKWFLPCAVCMRLQCGGFCNRLLFQQAVTETSYSASVCVWLVVWTCCLQCVEKRVEILLPSARHLEERLNDPHHCLGGSYRRKQWNGTWERVDAQWWLYANQGAHHGANRPKTVLSGPISPTRRAGATRLTMALYALPLPPIDHLTIAQRSPGSLGVTG